MGIFGIAFLILLAAQVFGFINNWLWVFAPLLLWGAFAGSWVLLLAVNMVYKGGKPKYRR